MSADERPQRAPDEHALIERRLVCRRCEQVISSADQIFTVEGSSAIGAYANPSGQLREVVTVRTAEGLDLIGGSSTEMSWFTGFAWRVAMCRGCREHIGWRYEREHAFFYGLLTKAIIEK